LPHQSTNVTLQKGHIKVTHSPYWSQLPPWESVNRWFDYSWAKWCDLVNAENSTL